jgi:hypothetical protein
MAAYRELRAVLHGRCWAFRGCVLGAGLLSLGCGASDHPQYYVDPGTGGASSAGGADGSGEATAMGDAGEASAGTAGVPVGTAGSTGITTGASGTLDASAVYVRAPFLSSNEGYALAAVASPNTYLYGFPVSFAGLRGNDMLYGSGGGGTPVRVFVPDSGGTPPPDAFDLKSVQANDPIVATEPCPEKAAYFMTGPRSRFIYQCESAGPWYENGKQVSTDPLNIYALGPGNLAITVKDSVFSVVNLTDEQPHVIANVSEVMAIRATATGFHLVANTPLGVTLFANVAKIYRLTVKRQQTLVYTSTVPRAHARRTDHGALSGVWRRA